MKHAWNLGTREVNKGVYCEFEAAEGYMMSSRPAWATKWVSFGNPDIFEEVIAVAGGVAQGKALLFKCNGLSSVPGNYGAKEDQLAPEAVL